MKDISIYFQAILPHEAPQEGTLGALIEYHTEASFPELKKKGMAIIYCPEFRNGNPELHQLKDDSFRAFFAELSVGPSWNFPIYDLGNLLPGESIKDTYFAVRQVVAELVKMDIIPIVIGGTQDLTYAVYQGYQALEQTVNMACIDAKLDLGLPENEISKEGYLSQILMNRPCVLFNHSLIGAQIPYIKQEEMELFEKLYFDICRLGEYNANFKVAEPLLRNADILSLDLTAIRSSDMRGEYYQAPNGFYAEQACQIVRYAGISDKLTSFGIFNHFPTKINASSNQLIAELIWYFLDGVSNRFGDFPVGSKKEYKKFLVHFEEEAHEIVFYKSNKSERWWMEVPYPPKTGVKYERHSMIPCNHEDYLRAMQNEMPDLWWKTYQKLG